MLLRNVDQQRGPQVRVFLELLDVVAVLLGPDFPVDVPQVVAGGVFAVLQELDRLAEVGAAMHARQKAFDDVPGPHVEPRDPRDRFRMQKSFGIGHRWSARLLWSGVICEQPVDDVVGRDPFALGGEVDHQPMPQHRLGQGLDVVGRDVRAAVQQRPGLGAQDQELHGPRPGAPAQLIADEVGRARPRRRASAAPATARSESRGR